jgi:hypothetical protein
MVLDQPGNAVWLPSAATLEERTSIPTRPSPQALAAASGRYRNTKGGDKRLMSIVQSIFLRMFGHIKASWGGGVALSWRVRTKSAVSGLPTSWRSDRTTGVLEVGFGPGVII